MSLLRRVTLSSEPRVFAQPVRQEVLEICRDSTADWDADKLAGYIRDNTKPVESIDIIVKHVMDNSKLASVSKEEFLAAAAMARPELHALLVSPAGDRWLEGIFLVLIGRLARAYATSIFRRSS